MSTGSKILLWAPRALLIAFALLLVPFSFDVFGGGHGPLETTIAFLLHNLPSMLIGLVVFAAWRHEWVGSAACLLLMLAYALWAWGRFPFLNIVIMTGPLLLIGLLYAVNWQRRRRLAVRESGG